MEHTATSGNFGPGTTGMTLQQAVFAGLVDPGNLVAVREIVSPTGSPMGPTAYTGATADCPAPTPDGAVARTVKVLPGTQNCDTAAFLTEIVTVDTVTGALDPGQYDILDNGDGSITVSDAAAGDGTDTLWNVENLRFCLANDANTGRCNSFYDIPINPSAPAAAPAIDLSAYSLTFAPADIGTASATKPITVTNVGTAPLVVSAVTTNDPSLQFTATSGCTTLAPSASCTALVTFSPTSAVIGARSATLKIESNAPGAAATVALDGTIGGVPKATMGSANVAFGNVTIGTASATKTITVKNTGTAPLTVTQVAIDESFANATLFTATSAGCNTLAVGASCTVTVGFLPTSIGPKTARISITHNANNLPSASTVLLSGTGVAPPPPPPPVVVPVVTTTVPTSSVPTSSTVPSSSVPTSPAAKTFVPLEPFRLLDTRGGNKVGNAAGTGTPLTLSVFGQGGLPTVVSVRWR